MLKDVESLKKAENHLQELRTELNKARDELKHYEHFNHRHSFRDSLLSKSFRHSRRQKSGDIERHEKIGESRSASSFSDYDIHNSQDRALPGSSGEAEDVDRIHQLETELRVTKEQLSRAESALSSKTWTFSYQLQLWLQLTHELELAHYTAKRQAAESQLALAKEGCEKLRRKRSSFLGSFKVAHGSSLDQVDSKILNAKQTLSEVTKALKERIHRWQQIENLCGFPIMTNKGLVQIQAELFVNLPNSLSVTDLSSGDTTGSESLSGGIGGGSACGDTDYVDVFSFRRNASFCRSSFRQRSIRSTHSHDRPSSRLEVSLPVNRLFCGSSKAQNDENSDGEENLGLKNYDMMTNRYGHYHQTNGFKSNTTNQKESAAAKNTPKIFTPRHQRTWSSFHKQLRGGDLSATSRGAENVIHKISGVEKSHSLNILDPSSNFDSEMVIDVSKPIENRTATRESNNELHHGNDDAVVSHDTLADEIEFTDHSSNHPSKKLHDMTINRNDQGEYATDKKQKRVNIAVSLGHINPPRKSDFKDSVKLKVIDYTKIERKTDLSKSQNSQKQIFSDSEKIDPKTRRNFSSYLKSIRKSLPFLNRVYPKEYKGQSVNVDT